MSLWAVSSGNRGQHSANTPRRRRAAIADGLEIRLHPPQETLAQLIGSTRQRVNQILKEWEAAGTVDQQYGHLTLLDRARLEQLAIS